jgi:hypothetical protein
LFYERHALLPQAGRSICANNTRTKKVLLYNRPNQLRKGYEQFKPAAADTFAHSGLQSGKAGTMSDYEHQQF